MNKKQTIEKLYFEESKSLTEISKEINVTIGYISRILKNNEKYLEEKDKRKNENLLQRRQKQKNQIYKNRKKKEIDLDYIAVQNSHIEASQELSKSSALGSETLRKWCCSAYKYNHSKHRYEFDAGNSAKPADFPQYIRV